MRDGFTSGVPSRVVRGPGMVVQKAVPLESMDADAPPRTPEVHVRSPTRLPHSPVSPARRARFNEAVAQSSDAAIARLPADVAELQQPSELAPQLAGEGVRTG